MLNIHKPIHKFTDITALSKGACKTLQQDRNLIRKKTVNTEQTFSCVVFSSKHAS